MKLTQRKALLACCLCCLFFSGQKAVSQTCVVSTVGLCDPAVDVSIETEVISESFNEPNGITTIETTTSTTTTTTTTNADSGDILSSGSGFVATKYEGDMDSDWGGQGSASMPSGSTCGDLGTDKCAQITGSGNTTSTMGVAGMGTTFKNTISLSSLSIDNGGKVNYTIKVSKEDASDRIYMHLTGYNGSTSTFSGTDILSESGVNSGYASYTGGFNFGGNLTSLIVEIGGRDINLSIGPMFDDVTVNVLYNVVNTIITQSITTIENFIALNIGVGDVVIDIAEDIFEHNDVIEVDGITTIEPMKGPNDATYDSVELELDAPVIEAINIKMDTQTQGGDTNVYAEANQKASVEAELEAKEEPKETVIVKVKAVEEEVVEVVEVVKEEVVKEEAGEEKKVEKEVVKKQVVKKNTKQQKQKVANKIVKEMGSKGRYDDANQFKTLMIMSVLADNKSFFNNQTALVDTVKLFSNDTVPDGVINDNNMALFLMRYGADASMTALIDIQYR